MRWIILTCLAAVAMSGGARAGELDSVVAKIAQDAIKQFEKEQLNADDFAITVLDLTDAEKGKSGSYRGGEGIYPASVVKLFYLAAAHKGMEDGKLKDSEELRRAMKDMIVRSTNDATNWILEAVTDTGNGPLLSDEEMKAWAERRNSINHWFTSMGYSGINVNQKTYNEGPYGREKLFIENNRNKLTTDATARLLGEIATGKCVSTDRSKQMMELLKREVVDARGGDNQASDFTAMALPKDAKLWSKAGWTSTARHDAAYFELPDGRKLITVIFTTGHARQREILPEIVRRIIETTPTRAS